jgi:putative salt-induced outer membrane protein YdiY
MPAMLRFFVFLGVLLTGVSVASAKVFRLTNGDRVSGEIVAADEHAIVVETAFLGQVRIPRSALADPLPADLATTVPGPPAEAAPPPPAPPPPAPPAPTPAPVVAASETAPVAVDGESVLPDSDPEQHALSLQSLPVEAYHAWLEFWEDNFLFRTLADIYPLMDWNNKVNIGIHLQDAQKDQRTFNLGFLTTRETGKHSARFQVTYDYSETTVSSAGVDAGGEPITVRRTSPTRDRLFGNARYRYEYMKSFFIQTDTRYQREPLKRLEHVVDELVGVGYTFIDTKRVKASVTPSLGLGFRAYEDEESEWEWLISLQQDLSIALTDRLKFSEESTLTYSPFEERNFTFSLKSILENQLNRRLSLRITYELDYSERVAATARTSQSVRFGFAASF